MDAVSKFWDWLATHARDYGTLPSAEIIDDISDAIATISPDLSVEMSTPVREGTRKLVITCHGEKELFPLVATVVQHSPRLEGWDIVAFKPPRGFKFKIAGINSLQIPFWRFVPLKDASKAKRFGLRIVIPEADERRVDGRILPQILEEGVGEVLLSVCEHIEWSSDPESGAMEIDTLAEVLYSWALVNGPEAVQPYLPSVITPQVGRD